MEKRGEFIYHVNNQHQDVDAMNIGDTLEDSFTYTVSDGEKTDTATLSITVQGTNDAPIAVADGYSNPTEGSAVEFVVSGEEGETVTFTWEFSTNDYMPFNDFAFASVNDQPLELLSNVSMVGDYGSSGAQTFSYVLTSTGTHTFSFGVVDLTDSAIDSYLNVAHSSGGALVDVDTIGAAISTIDGWALRTEGASVSDIDVFVDSNMALNELVGAIEGYEGNESDAMIPAERNVLDNDYDVDNDHSMLSVVAIESGNTSNDATVETDGSFTIVGQYGTININPDGSFTYNIDDSNPNVDALNVGDSLNETFTYTVSDNQPGRPKTDSAPLLITINGTNDAPNAVDDFNEVTEDFFCEAVAQFPYITAVNGVIDFSYVANGNVIAGVGSPNTTPDSDVDNVNLSVIAIADNDENYQVPQGQGEGSSYAMINGEYGVLHIYANGDYTYILNNSAQNVQSLAEGQSVTDVFTYTLSDNESSGAKTDTANLEITINGTNDIPIISEVENLFIPENIVMPGGEVLVGDVDATDIDTGDTLTFSIANGNDDGLFEIDSESGQIYMVKPVSYEEPTLGLGLGENSQNQYNLEVTATDNHGAAATTTVDINITNVAPLYADPEKAELFRNEMGCSASKDSYYEIDPDQTVEVSARWMWEEAGYNNSYGYYFADASGKPIIGGVIWGDANEPSPRKQTVTLKPSEIPDNAVALGFFLASDAWDHNPHSSLGYKNPIYFDENNNAYFDQAHTDPVLTAQNGDFYFSDPSLNPTYSGWDAADPDHEWQFAKCVFGWEDQGNTREGLGDHNDPVIRNWVSQIDSEVTGTQGHDEIIGSYEPDVLVGKGGNDFIYGGEGDDTLRGGKGDDLMVGGEGDDYIKGGAGEDRIYGGEGDDVIEGDRGSDTLMGGEGDDVLMGERGADTLHGGEGSDDLYGGRGDDTMVFDRNDGTVDGGEGYDTIVLRGNQSINFNSLHSLHPDLEVKNIERIDLSDGDHTLHEITSEDVLDMTNATNTLVISGDGEDRVTLDDSSWSQEGSVDIDGSMHDIYTAVFDGYDVCLHIDDDVVVDFV